MIPDIPPKWIIEAAREALDTKNHWVDYYDVLSEYYGIAIVKAYNNPKKVSETAIASYYPSDNPPTIYGGKDDYAEVTALHEFFHHLASEKELEYSKVKSEALANSFSREIIRRYGER